MAAEDPQPAPPRSVRIGRYRGRASIDRMRERFPEAVVFAPVSRDAEGRALSPFVLRDGQGSLVENAWQFRKVYAEHMDGDAVLASYRAWREAGLRAAKPNRFPLGKGKGPTTRFFLTDDGRRLGYVPSRKEFYVPTYIEAVRRSDAFEALRRAAAERDLILLDFDGPCKGSMPYYRAAYGDAAAAALGDVAGAGLMDVTMANLGLMLNDPRHPFGHGYALAMALMWWTVEDVDAARPMPVIDDLEAVAAASRKRPRPRAENPT